MKTRKPSNAAKAKRSGRRLPLGLIAAVLLAGIGARVYLTEVSTREGYLWDHIHAVSRGETIRTHGLLQIYNIAEEDLVPVDAQIYRNDEWVTIKQRGKTLFNYPPLAPTLVWIASAMLPEPIKANTFSARLIMGIFPTICELITAIGVAMLGWQMFGRRAALWTGCLFWLLPPVILNTAFWGQVDSYFLAPAVFLVLFLIKRKWLAAGICLAVACLLKPQGLILGPVALFAALLLPAPDGRSYIKAVILRLATLGGAFVAAIALLTLPWMITSGLAWFQRSYVVSFVEAFPRTTLKGFNIWYIDLLILDGKHVVGAMDSEAVVAGLAKDTWGKLLVFAAMFAFAGLSWWRYRRTPLAVIVFSAMWLWSVFMLPTRVHERFIIYCIPLMLIVAAALRRTWPVLLILLIVATAAHCHTVWLKGGVPAGAYNPDGFAARSLQAHEMKNGRLPPAVRARKIQQFRMQYPGMYERARMGIRTKEYVVTILSIVCYLFAAVALFVKPPPPDLLPGKQQRKERKI